MFGQLVRLGLVVASAATALHFTKARAAPASAAAAPGVEIGSATGLPVPRFVSLKFDRVNLREGPSMDHPTLWVFERKALPVEVTAESEMWRRVRASDGVTGWVLNASIAGRRTAIVAPWKPKADAYPIYSGPNGKDAVVARLQVGVIGDVTHCDGKWCRIAGKGFAGDIPQDELWGVYPNEKFD
ncbi:MAG: hypothetical protein KGI57_03770 [Hyphomicrobiales bacterium]|nr:hypothetical protein [Hyphomicrobiales bacterium]MDE2016805.1 hypothetical protein [Hyphomicrobiales bacterium]